MLIVNIGNDGRTLRYGTDINGSLLFGSPTANAETEFLNGFDVARQCPHHLCHCGNRRRLRRHGRAHRG